MISPYTRSSSALRVGGHRRLVGVLGLEVGEHFLVLARVVAQPVVLVRPAAVRRFDDMGPDGGDRRHRRRSSACCRTPAWPARRPRRLQATARARRPGKKCDASCSSTAAHLTGANCVPRFRKRRPQRIAGNPGRLRARLEAPVAAESDARFEDRGEKARRAAISTRAWRQRCPSDSSVARQRPPDPLRKPVQQGALARSGPADRTRPGTSRPTRAAPRSPAHRGPASIRSSQTSRASGRPA